MPTIRIHCPHCAASALLRPQQVLLVPRRSGATYLFTCPACARVTDAPAGPEPVLLLAAAGVAPVDGLPVRGDQPTPQPERERLTGPTARPGRESR
jgi:hypothetical protein